MALISTIQALYNKDVVNYLGEMETYLEFSVDGKDVKTSVAKNQGQDPDWDDTLTLPHTHGNEIKVRALTHRQLLPNTLIGEASLAISSLQTGIATTLTLLSKDGDKAGGEVHFMLSDKGSDAAEDVTGGALLVTAGGVGHDLCAQATTACFSGAGATAYPAKGMGGEHLQDQDPGATSLVTGTAGIAGSGARGYPALRSGKDLGEERLHDFPGIPAHSRDYSSVGASTVSQGLFPNEGQTGSEKGTSLKLSKCESSDGVPPHPGLMVFWKYIDVVPEYK